MEKRLYRSRSNRMIWGVCGGLADYFDIAPAVVRIIAVLLVFVNGLGILAYIILAIVLPLEGSAVSEPKDVIKENVAEMKETAIQLGSEIRSTFVKKEKTTEELTSTRHRNYIMLGVILIVIGVLLVLANFNLFWWFRWRYLWALILVAIGALIIWGARRK